MGNAVSPVQRELPSDEARQLLDLVRDLARRELEPRVAEYEEKERFPREVFTTLGEAGVLSLPFPEKYGGGEQPYQVYLQVLEELASRWLAVALGVSVHVLSCHGVAYFGSEQQRVDHLPAMLEGDALGAYCLSEPQAGSDAAALRTRATWDGDAYQVHGTKAWISHSGQADFYTLMARTGDAGAHGVSAFLVPGDAPGLTPGEPERKMGMNASRTAQLFFDGVRLPAERRIGDEGAGMTLALSALDCGRLGMAACAVGLAQAALEQAVDYATRRQQFGEPIGHFQGVSFLLADMATRIEAARALYLSAARRRDQGQSFGKEAAMAKLFCTDTAMSVTTDAVQVLGGYGYTQDFPAERYMREAKVLQIVEGTNQIQRMVIGRHLTG